MRLVTCGMFVMFLFVAIAGRALGGDAAGAKEAAGKDAPNATALWAKNCASCHGQAGKGDTKIGKMKKLRDLSAPDVHASLSRDAVIKMIKEGITDAESGKVLMKGYADKLSEAEIEILADHALALGKK